VRELQDHIKYLSSDSLKGRMTGTQGDSLAAEYIRNELATLGFIPISGDGLQRFRVTSRLLPGDGNVLSIDGQSFVLEKDFTPFVFSSDSELEAEVIFAGYGFQIDQEELKWDDYTSQDVSGKTGGDCIANKPYDRRPDIYNVKILICLAPVDYCTDYH